MYLSTVLDDYSRFIVSWRLCSTMAAADVTATLDQALEASGCAEAPRQSDVEALLASGSLLAWPREPKPQLLLIKGALAEAELPLSANALAARFKGRKAVLEVPHLLATLERLGQVRATGGGYAGWTGTIQWIDSGLRGGGERRNWFVAVHRIAAPASPAMIRKVEVRFEAMRAGGPGRQHQNVTESAVRAVHIPTGLSAVARDGRSQHQNRKRALDRLGALMAGVAVREAMVAKRAEWLDRITVERGNPKRTIRDA